MKLLMALGMMLLALTACSTKEINDGVNNATTGISNGAKNITNSLKSEE